MWVLWNNCTTARSMVGPGWGRGEAYPLKRLSNQGECSRPTIPHGSYLCQCDPFPIGQALINLSTGCEYNGTVRPRITLYKLYRASIVCMAVALTIAAKGALYMLPKNQPESHSTFEELSLVNPVWMG